MSVQGIHIVGRFETFKSRSIFEIDHHSISQRTPAGSVAISANSALTHPQDGPDAMASEASRYGFPYLYDETQETAKASRFIDFAVRRVSWQWQSCHMCHVPSCVPLCMSLFPEIERIMQAYGAVCTPEFFVFDAGAEGSPRHVDCGRELLTIDRHP
jgi:hypothetical protein